jgi:peptide methionine sulfoxide reductase MsrA
MEQRDRSVPGTQAQRAVFAGGTTANPGYDEVCAREGLVAYLPRCEAFSTHGDTT